MDLIDLKSKLQAVDNSSLVDKVEDRLVGYFVENNLKAGDSIPTELELAGFLGVSRTVVREALSRLRTIGLIESKKKKGSVLVNPDLMGVLEKSLIARVLDEDTLRDLFEFRLVIEVGMADFIMARVTRTDIEALKEIVAVEPEWSQDLAFNIEHETRFHGKLYEIAGNDTLKKFQKLLLPLFDYVHRSGLLRKPVSQNKFVSHKGIVQTIEHGSAEMLRNAMRNHLENHFSRLF